MSEKEVKVVSISQNGALWSHAFSTFVRQLGSKEKTDWTNSNEQAVERKQSRKRM